MKDANWHKISDARVAAYKYDLTKARRGMNVGVCPYIDEVIN